LWETTRQITALHKKCGGLEQKLEVRDKEISTHAALSRQVCLYFVSLLFLSSNLLIFLLKIRAKQEERNSKAKKERHTLQVECNEARQASAAAKASEEVRLGSREEESERERKRERKRERDRDREREGEG
jgi:hypothetical protein